MKSHALEISLERDNHAADIFMVRSPPGALIRHSLP